MKCPSSRHTGKINIGLPDSTHRQRKATPDGTDGAVNTSKQLHLEMGPG